MNTDQYKDYPRVPISDLMTFEGRAKHLYTIQPKSGKNEKFTLLESQKYLDDIVEEEYERTKREFGHAQVRIIINKCRQAGLTTYCNVRSIDRQLYDSGSNGIIVAHDTDTTEKIYVIYKRVYDNLPPHIIPEHNGKDMNRREYLKFLSKHRDDVDITGIDLSSKEYDETMVLKIKPETENYSGKRIGFKDMDSVTNIFTAGRGDTGGLGGTIRRVHLSEAASYSKYKDLLTALNPSIPDFVDDLLYVIESTPNGTTGDGEGFYHAWTNAVKGWEDYMQGKTQTYRGLRPVFIPWYSIEEYQLPLSGGKYVDIDRVAFGSPEEKAEFLKREQTLLTEGIFNPLSREIQILTPEQINWYRMIMNDTSQFDYRVAQRFYPTTPEESFLASSNSYFDSYQMNESKTKLLNDPRPYEIGNIEYDEYTGELVFVEDVLGDVRIWKHPEPDWENRYVIGADISRNRLDGDYSTAYVKDRITQEYVAYYHGKVDQDIFANILMEMGIYYNEALLVPESNLDMVVELIKPDGLTPYVGEVYYNEHLDTRGFWTSGSSSNVLLSRYKTYLRDNPKKYDVLPDIAIIEEHISFVRNVKKDSTKYEADEGKFDDRVIACALANIADEDWGEAPKQYKPSRIQEIISRKPRKRRNIIKDYELGRNW